MLNKNSNVAFLAGSLSACAIMTLMMSLLGKDDWAKSVQAAQSIVWLIVPLASVILVFCLVAFYWSLWQESNQSYLIRSIKEFHRLRPNSSENCSVCRATEDLLG